MLITEFCNTFFDKRLWASCPQSEKEAHGFNILRFISIKLPYHMNLMNHKDLNIPAALEFWHSYMSARFSGVPKWFWVTAGENKKRLEKNKIPVSKMLKDEFDGSLLNMYCNHVGCNFSDLQDEYEMEPKAMIASIKKYREAVKASAA